MGRVMSLYTMDLFSRDRIRDDMLVYRVPGGWIYELLSDGDSTTAVFVPWSSPVSLDAEKDQVARFARRNRAVPRPRVERKPI